MVSETISPGVFDHTGLYCIIDPNALVHFKVSDHDVRHLQNPSWWMENDDKKGFYIDLVRSLKEYYKVKDECEDECEDEYKENSVPYVFDHSGTYWPFNFDIFAEFNVPKYVVSHLQNPFWWKEDEDEDMTELYTTLVRFLKRYQNIEYWRDEEEYELEEGDIDDDPDDLLIDLEVEIYDILKEIEVKFYS